MKFGKPSVKLAVLVRPNNWTIAPSTGSERGPGKGRQEWIRGDRQHTEDETALRTRRLVGFSVVHSPVCCASCRCGKFAKSRQFTFPPLFAGLAGGPLGGAVGPGRPGPGSSSASPYMSASMMAAQDPFSSISQTGDTKLLQQCEYSAIFLARSTLNSI